MKENSPAPTVIHIGKKSRKEIKKYKMGFGNMFSEVQHILEKAKTQAAPGTEILPIVAIHHKKRKKGIIAGGSRILGL